MGQFIVDLPDGMDPNDPRIRGFLDDQFGMRRQQRMPPNELLKNEHYINQMNAHTARIVSDIRKVDAQLFLDFLHEIRTALGSHMILDGDKGSTDRPPVDAAFDEQSRTQLRNSYLNVTLRYAKYIDTVCEKDFQFLPPNSITDRAKSAEKSAAEKKKKT